MKKLFSILLVLSMVLCFVGCSNNSKKEVDDNLKNNIIDNNSANKEEVKFEETEKFLGNWDGNIYKNEYLNFEYVKPEEWERLPDEELIQNRDLELEGYSGEIIENIKSTYFDFMGVSEKVDGNNLVLTAVKTNSEETSKDYLEVMKNEIEKIEDSETKKLEIEEVELSNNKYNLLTINVLDNIVEKHYARKVDNYIIEIIALSINGEEGIQELLSNIK